MPRPHRVLEHDAGHLEQGIAQGFHLAAVGREEEGWQRCVCGDVPTDSIAQRGAAGLPQVVGHLPRVDAIRHLHNFERQLVITQGRNG